MKLVLRPPARPQTTADVDAERERRLGAGFLFNGKCFQGRTVDLINITGAVAAASMAIANGATAGDYRWANPEEDFCWIVSDNSLVPLDAPSVVQMGQTAMGFVAAHMMAARLIKDRITGGEVITDVVDNSLWP